MKLPLLLIAVILMFSGAQGISQSMSCSTVNGRTICEEQQNAGNTAISSSMAMSGPGMSHQDVYAGAGNPGGDWASGRQTATGGVPYQQGYQQGSQQGYQQGPQQGYQQGPQQGYQQGPQQGYPQQQQSQQQQPQQEQQTFNPFQWVNRFMTGGANVGPGFAGAGAGGGAYAGPGVAYAGNGAFPMPFGRR